MKSFKIIALGLLALFAGGASPAAAKVDVVTANQDLAWVVRAVGGSNVSVEYLSGSNQDPHRVDPRPSQVVKLARADMVVRIGMDLDTWFDSLIRAAGNSKITNGAKGYVDASRGIRRMEVPAGKLDPSKGDIHVFGNPHYFFGPSNLATVADNIREALKRIDPANGNGYDSSYVAMVAQINNARGGWMAKMAPHRGKGVVTYHKSLAYFLRDFGLRDAGQVEPRPGLEPTAGHVISMARSMKEGNVKVIMTEGFRARRFADLLASRSGARVVVVPGGIGAEKGINDYLALMNAMVDRVSAAL